MGEKYGGSVKRDMNGKQKSTIETMEAVVLIALNEKKWQFNLRLMYVSKKLKPPRGGFFVGWRGGVKTLFF